ncbi:MAG: carbohydrate binding domain-containing protein [Ruminococcus sp.]|nr:carbohydrate binding domain-containing protein [Ruminococcus sp.]
MRTKKSIKKAVSLLLTVAMILSLLASSVCVADALQYFTMYFQPNSNWLDAGARFAVYQFDSKGNYSWANMELFDDEQSIYVAELDRAAYQNFIFCRMKTGTEENNWDNRWNQTVDLSYPDDGYNLFMLDNSGDGWNKLYGIWSTYEHIVPTEPSTVAPTTFSYDNVLVGDADMSGYINVSDVTLVQTYLAFDSPLDEWATLVADSNGDSKIDIKDATLIQMYLAGLDVNNTKVGQYYSGGSYDGNLLRNGNFEYDKAGSSTPSWWESYNNSLVSVCNDSIVGSNCLKIDNSNYGWQVSVFQRIKGLEPGQIYRVNSYIKAENIQGSQYDNGAHVKVENSYMVEAQGNWLKGNSDWREVMVYFVANKKGEADIILRTDNAGIVYFDDVKVTKVAYPDMYSAKIVLKGEYVDTYVKRRDIEKYTDEELQTWIDYLDKAYKGYVELTGTQPYDGNKAVINCTDEPLCSRYYAYAGSPIMFNNKFVASTIENTCKYGVVDFGMFHEIGHNFDTMFDWTFDGEITANYKMAYILDSLGDTKISLHSQIKASEFREYCRSYSDGSYSKIENRTYEYAGDGICYVMLRATDAVGWDTVKATFREFSENGIPSIRTQWGKFSYFMYRLQANYNKLNKNSTGTEVIDTFPQGELDYLRGLFYDHYGSDAYIYVEDFFIEENARF